jgi:hypothetical protein
MPSGKPWPQVAIDMLVGLNADGWSYGVIAGKMNMTRNAVIGKAHRLKLKPNSTPTQQLKKSKPKKVVTNQPKSKKGPLIFRSSAANRKPPSIELVTKAVDPTGMGVKITKLEWNGGVPTNCRAILRGEGKDSIYCGKKNEHGSSYCPEHTERFHHRAPRDIFLKKEALR